MRTHIIEECLKLQDSSYQKFNLKLTPDNTYQMIGVRMPFIHKLVKQALKEDPFLFLQEVESFYYEEVLIQGLVITNLDLPLSEKLILLEQYMPKITNWAICDLVVGSIKNDTKDLFNFALTCCTSHHPYEIRFGVVCFINYFVDPSTLKKVLKTLLSIANDNYYVKMAIAWCMAECFIQYPDESLASLIQLKDTWTCNKTIQKVRESHRPSKEVKDSLLQYKK